MFRLTTEKLVVRSERYPVDCLRGDLPGCSAKPDGHLGRVVSMVRTSDLSSLTRSRNLTLIQAYSVCHHESASLHLRRFELWHLVLLRLLDVGCDNLGVLLPSRDEGPNARRLRCYLVCPFYHNSGAFGANSNSGYVSDRPRAASDVKGFNQSGDKEDAVEHSEERVA